MKTEFLGLNNRFYTLIPHASGRAQPPYLTSQRAVQSKREMIEALMGIEITTSMVQCNRTGLPIEHPLDINYRSLSTELVLVSEPNVLAWIDRYIKNTHGPTHGHFSLDLQEVFEVTRREETARFTTKLHNRRLLWHGSRTTNFVGILSQGLRIAPREAPMSGYSFGKGVYFADSVSKSATYCHIVGAGVGILLLCDVALGDMYTRTSPEFMDKPPVGLHSTFGAGRYQPLCVHTCVCLFLGYTFCSIPNFVAQSLEIGTFHVSDVQVHSVGALDGAQ